MKKWQLFLLLALSAWAAGLPAEGFKESMPAVLQPVQDLLQRAALDGSPGSLLLVVLILGVLPFSVVVPMTVGSLLAGFFLPPRIAPPIILAGMLLNTLLAWTIARTVFGRRLEAWIEKRGGALGNLRLAAQKAPFKWSLLSRFIPAPFVAAPMVLASAGVSLGQVLGATALVMTPWSFAYSWAGRAGREGSVKSMGLAALGLVAIILLSSWAYRRYVVPAEAKDAKSVPKRRKVKK